MLDLEEFKNNITLKTKVMQESVSSASTRLNEVESRTELHYNYLVKLKKRHEEMQAEKND